MSQTFPSLFFSFQPGGNGDNESRNSSMLLALDLVLRGSRHRIESLGTKALLSPQAAQGQTFAFSYHR